MNEQACLRQVSSYKYISSGTFAIDPSCWLPLTLSSPSPRVSYFKFSRIPTCFFSVTSSLCFVFPAYLTVASHGDSVAESVFASHLFYCSTSVKSEADVHLIKHNTLVINSCLHQLRHIDRGLALQVAYFIAAFRENAGNPRSMIAALSCLQCAHWSHSTFKSLFTFQAPASWINSDLNLTWRQPGGKVALWDQLENVNLLTKVVKLFVKRVTCCCLCH